MNVFPCLRSRLRWLLFAVGVVVLAGLAPARAFPPAPYHRIYGVVRDEYGQPVANAGARIVFTATNGVTVMATIRPGLAPGVNYQVDLPMDAGVTSDRYKPTALKATVAFRIQVQIGGNSYLPMEMAGGYARLGKPATSTRIDLTLGVDADGDGLPDAWQGLLRTMLGEGTKVGPNESALGNGVSNLSMYLAGVYAFDPSGGFRLSILPQEGGRRVVEFGAAAQHTYTLESTTDLVTWTAQPFKIPAKGPSDGVRTQYFAPAGNTLQLEPQHSEAEASVVHVYRLRVW